MPQLGFLLKLPMPAGMDGEGRRAVEEAYAAEGLQYQFDADGDLYFKGGSCEGLDADYGDIGSRLKDVEAQIIRRLEAEPLTPSSTDGMRMAC